MKLVITIGDCNGIGIEVMFKSLRKFILESEYAADCDITISGRKDVLENYNSFINDKIDFTESGLIIEDKYCQIYDCPTYSDIYFGKISLSAGKLSAEAIEYAVNSTISGIYDAIITMPVSKESLYMSGWAYPGHTEMLADYCKADSHLMMLCSGNLKVAPATIHIPISRISESLSIDMLKSAFYTLNESLISDFGIAEPTIAVLGLNPHAGENGSIGTEELEIISPAINSVLSEGLSVYGPFPADGFFAHGDYKDFDGIISMYHDQGLIPLKLLAGGGGVNYTAGLPIVRTSPDHGTAFSIAGKGKANPQSSFDALEMACQIVKVRDKKKP